ncbi:putative nuclease HARBI1 [Topomyia yanbarensis]|uniref:putative nuclease HARBI1 n=1 Tax=Topomyia yanbarensis TaxID=2498891 RepID=UPI00273C562D|nr:putative nuclease HARBI1 [Topomyia yanbarensis]
MDYSCLLSDSSDDDLDFMSQMLNQAQAALAETQDQNKNKCERKTREGKRPNIERSAQEGAQRLVSDYFSVDPTYTDEHFRRRFRMNRNLFTRIVNEVKSTNVYFVQRADATGKIGLSTLQKCTAAIRQLAYGSPADAIDEYTRMSESSARSCMLEFCRTIVDRFASQYLRSPNSEDIKRLLDEGQKRGFPGMLGSLDCCHWEWKNCPTAWAGQYKGKGKKPTIILEAVASQDLWIWHAFFGMPGSNNDLNVLERSPLFSDLYSGRNPQVEFIINDRVYTTGYYLADGIYPPLSTLVQTITSPVGQKRKHFAKMQEAARKDVERAFGVLMARFAILKNPARLWRKEDLATIMRACIILHNMIIEDQRNDASETDVPFNCRNSDVTVNMGSADGFQAFLERYDQVHNATLHYQLQADLIEHLWKVKGEEEE